MNKLQVVTTEFKLTVSGSSFAEIFRNTDMARDTLFTTQLAAYLCQVANANLVGEKAATVRTHLEKLDFFPAHWTPKTVANYISSAGKCAELITSSQIHTIMGEGSALEQVRAMYVKLRNEGIKSNPTLNAFVGNRTQGQKKEEAKQEEAKQEEKPVETVKTAEPVRTVSPVDVKLRDAAEWSCGFPAEIDCNKRSIAQAQEAEAAKVEAARLVAKAEEERQMQARIEAGFRSLNAQIDRLQSQEGIIETLAGLDDGAFFQVYDAMQAMAKARRKALKQAA